MKIKLLVTSLVGASLLSGCFALPKADYNEATAKSEAAQQRLRNGQAQNTQDGLRVVKSAYLGSREVTDADRKTWLTSKRVSFSPSKRESPSARSLAIMLREEFGLNISSSLPLETFTYTGMGVRDVDGETALKLLFGPMGLDYDINNDGKYITIVPIRSRTWTLSIGNRNTTFSSQGNQNGSNTNNSSTDSNSGSASTNSLFSGASSANSDGNMNPSSSTSTQGDNNKNGASSISTKDTVWVSLEKELTARLKVMMPNTSPASALIPAAISPTGLNAPLPSVMPGVNPVAPTADINSLYRTVQVGTFALNPDTGAVTVQAPSWMLDGIGKYLDDVEATYNTRLTFEGQLLLLTASRSNSEGMDVQAFIRWAGGRYGAVLGNSVLNGGVQVSFPNGSLIPSIATGAATVAPTNLGIISPLDGLQIFNGYLESIGDVHTLQKPTVSSTHGVPGKFEKYTTETYAIPDQNVASGATGGAVAATRNILMKEQFGTKMVVFPRYDAKTGLVRAQVYLNYNVKVGTDKVPFYVSGPGGQTIQQITEIPKPSRTEQDGEILARDGDLVILSGTVEDSDSITKGGITGLSDFALTGNRARNSTLTTYYLAIRVRVERRGLK